MKNDAHVTFSWDTSGLTNATSIATGGTGNYDLTFTWYSSNATATVDSVTLTATDSTNSDQESQTYYFRWPTSLSPDTVGAGAAAWGSDGVSVDANSGALNTSVSLPSYNPDVPGLALTYNSLTADPRPIIVVNHTLDPSQSVPSKVSATLTLRSQFYKT